MFNAASKTDRDLLHSRPIDLHVWCFHPDINVFVDEIHEKYFVCNGQQEKNIGKHHLKIVLINLYLAWIEDPDLCLTVDLNNNVYKKNFRYHRLQITKKIISIIKLLVEQDLIDLVNGFYKRGGGSRKSRIWPSLKLVGYFNKLKIDRFYFTDGCYLLMMSRKSLSNAKGTGAEYKKVGVDRECIIRRENNMGKKPYQMQNQMPYKDTPKIRSMRQDLMAYNYLLAQTHISLGFLDESYLEVRRFTRRVKMTMPDNLHQRVRRIPVNQYFKFTSREFSSKNWRKGGRHIGGWWQKIPSEYRSDIRINNRATIEVDYSDYYIALLYAEKGKQYWKTIGKDPYVLTGSEPDFFSGRIFFAENKITQKNQMPAINRQCVKILCRMLLKSKTLENAYSAFRKNIRDNQPIWADRINWTNEHLNEVTTSIKQMHSSIAEFLGSGSGMQLDFVESEITAKLLKYFTKRGVVVLTVDASYVVQEEYHDELIVILQDLWWEEIQKRLRTLLKKPAPVSAKQKKITPIRNKVGQHFELFDSEKVKNSRNFQVIRSRKSTQKLSDTFLREYSQFKDFCSNQKWVRNISAF